MLQTQRRIDAENSQLGEHKRKRIEKDKKDEEEAEVERGRVCVLVQQYT